MVTREEATRMAERLIDHPDLDDILYKLKNEKTHFGYVEMRMLLDYIYGGAPTCEEEHLINPNPCKSAIRIVHDKRR